MLNKFQTPAIMFVIHALVALIAGAVISGLTVAGQAAFQNNVSPSLAIGTGLTAFAVSLAHSWYALRNNPQFAQAESDVSHQLETITGNHQALANQVAALYQQVAQSPQAAQLAAMVTEAVTQRVQAALPTLIAQHIATIPQAPVQVQQSTPAAYSGPQVPFPNAVASAYSTPNIATSLQPPAISFGDTGVVPTLPK